jgi:hypothetical protein
MMFLSKSESVPTVIAPIRIQGTAILAVTAVVGVAALALLFRVALDQSGEHLTSVYLDSAYRGLMSRLVAEKPFWYFLLPMPDIKGVWATTSFVPLYFFETTIGPNSTFLIASTAAILAFGWFCWVISGSPVMTLVGSAAFGFSPFNYSVYLWNGSNNVYCTVAFLSLASGAFTHYVLHGRSWLHLFAGGVALVFAALSYEVWLDYVAMLVLAAPFLWRYARRWCRPDLTRRASLVLAVTVGFAVIYVIVRLPALSKTVIPGLELQLLTSYSSIGPIIDDGLYNLIFHFYLAAIQLLPGKAGTSLAISEVGRLNVSQLTQGYQPGLYWLVHTHFLYLWQIYGTALFMVVLFAAVVLLKRAFANGDWERLVLGCLCLALLVGSPTHDLIKFVAFNAVPFYAYKVVVAVMVLHLLFAFLAWRIYERTSNAPWRAAVPVTALIYIGWIAFTRPAWANQNILEIWGESGFFGDGFYPDPWLKLLSLLGLGT